MWVNQFCRPRLPASTPSDTWRKNVEKGAVARWLKFFLNYDNTNISINTWVSTLLHTILMEGNSWDVINISKLVEARSLQEWELFRSQHIYTSFPHAVWREMFIEVEAGFINSKCWAALHVFFLFSIQKQKRLGKKWRCFKRFQDKKKTNLTNL